MTVVHQNSIFQEGNIAPSVSASSNYFLTGLNIVEYGYSVMALQSSIEPSTYNVADISLTFQKLGELARRSPRRTM